METKSKSSQLSTQEKNEPFLNIQIKHVDYINNSIRYRMDMKTNLNQYPIKEVHDIERTYSEFIKLYDYLTSNYQDRLIPCLPPITLANIKLVNNQALPKYFLQDMQKFLNRITNHFILFKDLELQTFLLSKFIYAPPNIKNNSLHLAYQGYRFEEDEEYGRLRANLMHIELILKEVYMSYNQLLKNEKKWAQTLVDRGAKLLSLGVAWTNLGEKAIELNSEQQVTLVLRKVGQLDQLESELYFQLVENQALLYFLEWQASASIYLMEVLGYRFNVTLEVDSAKLRCERRELGLIQLKKATTLNQTKVDAALEEFEAAKKYLEYRENQYQRIHSNLPNEIERYQNERLIDGISHLTLLAENAINVHLKLMQSYQTCLDLCQEFQFNEPLNSNVTIQSSYPLSADIAAVALKGE